ncbi:THUMP domain-containing protein 1, partial [Quaeritorhiza haematococci]
MTDRKRPASGQSGDVSKRKRAKKYLASKGDSYVKSLAVEPGMSGILVTCHIGREKQCSKELGALFNEYADQLYGAESWEQKSSNGASKSTSDTTGADDHEKEEREDEGSPAPTGEDSSVAAENGNGSRGSGGDSIEDAFAKEMQMLKAPRAKRRFCGLNVGIDCCVFVKTSPPINPVQLLSHILTDLSQKQSIKQTKKTRYTLRLHPIQETCYANMKDILEMAGRILKPWFHDGEKSEGVKYAIVPKIRNNDKIDRKELIDAIAAEVGTKHKVDLEKPDLCIIVEVFK